jgi:hypothetical protein
LGNAERAFAYIQEFNCKTEEGTWQKGNGVRADMYEIMVKVLFGYILPHVQVINKS